MTTTTRRGPKGKAADQHAIRIQSTLPPDLHQRWQASGIAISQLVRQALDAIDADRAR